MLLYATNHSLAIAQEILQCGVHAAGDDMDNTVIVYTNADIAVQPHFYAYADKLAKVSTGENISYRYHDCCPSLVIDFYTMSHVDRHNYS